MRAPGPKQRLSVSWRKRRQKLISLVHPSTLANEAGKERRGKEEAEDGRGMQAGAGETAVGHCRGRIVTIAGREIVGATPMYTGVAKQQPTSRRACWASAYGWQEGCPKGVLSLTSISRVVILTGATAF